jgi:hypothetical protein
MLWGPKQKKRNARSTKEHTYHVSALEVEPRDRRKDEFHALIDDVLYGPLTKIKYLPLSYSPLSLPPLHPHVYVSCAHRIGPCLSSKESKASLSLPVMTFFPLGL